MIMGRRKFKTFAMVVDTQAEGRGTRTTRSLSSSHSLPPPLRTPFSLYFYRPFSLITPYWGSCVRDTYGSAPLAGLVRGAVTEIPSSRFHPSHRRVCCWNHRGHGSDTALGGFRLESRRFLGRWSCLRYVAALHLHDGTLFSNPFFFLLPSAMPFVLPDIRHIRDSDSIWDGTRCRRWFILGRTSYRDER